MARPRDADGGDGLQIWKVAANIINKQSEQPTRSGPLGSGLGKELRTPHHKKATLLRNDTRGFWNWTDSLE
jgi:hypothetical protein